MSNNLSNITNNKTATMRNNKKDAFSSATSAHDQKVKQLFDLVQTKKAAIAKAEKPNWNTSGLFRFVANSAHESINIQTATDTRKLVEILSFLIGRERDAAEAAESLGVSYDFSWLGFTTEEWEQDLTTRVNQLSIQAKKKELSDLETRLSGLISPELKAQMELEAIESLLK